MPVRSVNLKMIVRRNDTTEAVRQRRVLWSTHCFVNEAPGSYQQILLEMRQAEVKQLSLAHSLTLVTHNVSEFARVPGLRTEDWEA